jgi:hypothetical protein
MAQRIGTRASLALSHLHLAVKFLQFCELLLQFPKLFGLRRARDSGRA